MEKQTTPFFDAIVIGGGIVGLATAWRLAEQQPNLKVAVVEKEAEVAKHQTGHNSGVIHSGIYYRPESLRARNCLDGYRQLLAFAQEHHIPHEICGKLIVATTPAEATRLDRILAHGQANGLAGIRRVSAAEAREREPHLNVVEAILVPQTGIIDYTAVALTYRRLLEAQGHQLFFGAKALAIRTTATEAVVETTQGAYRARVLINCAGLYSDKVADLSGNAAQDLRIIPFRGEYYQLKPEKRHLVKHLIYPVPNPDFPFLGVHFTRTMQGQIEAGPNAVLAFRREGYHRWSFHPGEFAETLAFSGFRQLAWRHWRHGLEELRRSYFKRAFVRALQQLVPAIQTADLEPAEAGVRAMACHRDGTLSDEFLIDEQYRVVNVCNAPSPAATASLAIGATIAAKALNQLNL